MRIKELRRQKGISQAELGNLLGVTRGAICNYEQGARIPNYKSVVTIADYFGVSVDYLLGRDEIETQEIKNLESSDLSEEKKLVSLITELTEEEMKELSNYADYLISKRQK